MEREKILETIADILEVDVDELSEDRELVEFDTWDSIAVLSVISVVSENTGKYLHASDIDKLVTIKNLMDVLSNE